MTLERASVGAVSLALELLIMFRSRDTESTDCVLNVDGGLQTVRFKGTLDRRRSYFVAVSDDDSGYSSL